jgi:hypothetical protein
MDMFRVCYSQPMTADVCQVKFGAGSLGLAPGLWNTAAREKCKLTKTRSRGLPLCSCSIDQVKKELIVTRRGRERTPSVFWKRACRIFSLSIFTGFIRACGYFD